MAVGGGKNRGTSTQCCQVVFFRSVLRPAPIAKPSALTDGLQCPGLRVSTLETPRTCSDSPAVLLPHCEVAKLIHVGPPFRQPAGRGFRMTIPVHSQDVQEFR